ncbi:hypothetical protein BU23DRAFT_244253, partial [Bimuria novae-zelandiae CBS 107.79]
LSLIEVHWREGEGNYFLRGLAIRSLSTNTLSTTMSHTKNYAGLRPAEPPSSFDTSESLPTPGQEKRYRSTTPPRRENRFRVIGAFIFLLSLGFNVVWLLCIITGTYETCHATQETRLVINDEYTNVYKKDNKAWKRLQGRNQGTIYTKDSRDDGFVRMGGISI